MRISTYALATALAGFAFAATATAQNYGGARPQKKEEVVEKAAESTEGKKLKISPKAQKAIVELQTAVNANDTAAIPEKLAAAQKVAESPDEKYFVAVNQLKAALNANDLAAAQVGLQAMEASGGGDTATLVGQYSNLGVKYYEKKQIDQAGAAFEKAVALDANNPSATKLLGSIRDMQGRKAEAITLLQKSLTLTKAAGQNPKESDYKFAAKLAYETKSPASAEITRSWLSDYPTATNWRDALRIYRDVNAIEGESKIDVMRLARAANALNGEGDYFGYATELVSRGHLNEAKAVIDEGGAKKAIDVNNNVFKQFAPKFAKMPTRAAIDASAKTALAGGSAKSAMDAGDALYGVGAFGEAAPLYKAAASRGGDANTANLRLGMALARSGDKAGATAALNAVTGAQANTAKYWLIWLNTQG
jgi:tetratricopeptide (TPR) repeat protein